MRSDLPFTSFPGGQLVQQGIADFQAGRCTVPACLIGIARTRRRRAGLLSESVGNPFPEAERQLNGLLRATGGGDA